MSEGTEVVTTKETKPSKHYKLKVILSAVLAFIIIVSITLAILYVTNTKYKKFVDGYMAKSRQHRMIKSREKREAKKDERIPELAKYYTTLTEKDATDKLTTIKAKDKKLYKEVMSSMAVIDFEKTQKISANIKNNEKKANIIKDEYDSMLAEKESKTTKDSSQYASLGTRGAINAIENKISTTMDYDAVAKSLETMQPNAVAKILYYMDSSYVSGISNRLSKKFQEEVETEEENYKEFLRKNADLGEVYASSSEESAAKELQDEKKFKNEQLAVIFSNMNYLTAARILDKFEDSTKVEKILEDMKIYEDLTPSVELGYTTDVGDSLKVLKKYAKDVDTLKRAYEKMQPEDLAEVIDKLIKNDPVYKRYTINKGKDFTITEKQMAIEVLKKIKPKLLGETIAYLKNNDKLDKAAIISREIGIP